MKPTEEEISFLIGLVEQKESEVLIKLGMYEPPSPANMIIIDLSGENYLAAYQPLRSNKEDVYVFGIGSYEDPNIEEIVAHEVVHRHYFWTIGSNSNPLLRPNELENLEKEIIYTQIADENQDMDLVINVFNLTLNEIFAYFGEMVVMGREANKIRELEEDPKNIEKIVDLYMPSTNEDAEQILNRIMNAVERSPETMEDLPSTLGHIIGLSLYKRFGTDRQNVEAVKNLFTGYDIRTIQPNEFNPFIRYVKLFMS